MLDLAEIDRRIEQLGTPVGDVPALLGRALGNDRSLARLDALLAELAQHAPGVAHPASSRPPGGARPSPRPSPLPVSARSGSPAASSPLPPAEAGATGRSEPSASAGGAGPGRASPSPAGIRSALPPRIVSPLAPIDAQQSAQRGLTPWPPRSSPAASSQPAPQAPSESPSSSAPAPSESELDAETRALFGMSEPPSADESGDEPTHRVATPVPRVSVPPPLPSVRARSMSPSHQTQDWSGGLADAAEDPGTVTRPAASVQPQPGSEPAPDSEEARARMRALLERELDPRDFPSSQPPPASETAQDGFEMLIDDDAEDDEEIMEIDDVELEEIDEG